MKCEEKWDPRHRCKKENNSKKLDNWKANREDELEIGIEDADQE